MVSYTLDFFMRIILFSYYFLRLSLFFAFHCHIKLLENSLRVSKTPALFHAVNRIGDVALNRFVEGISRIKHVPPPSRIS